MVEHTEDVPRLVANNVGEFGIACGSIQQHEGITRSDPLRESEETPERIKRIGPPDVNSGCSRHGVGGKADALRSVFTV